jgi:hypothetical protein
MRSTHHRWSHALAAGLLLAGCKSNKDAEPAPKAEATAPAAKPAPAPAPTPAAISDATLSYLEDSPDKKCRWVQHTPPAEPKTVFTFAADCSSASLAWNADGREALVFSSGSKKPDVWRVDLATGKGTPLASLPSRGDFGTIGFDAQGRPVALMDELYMEGTDTPPSLKVEETGTGEDAKKQFVFEGQRYDLAMDGIPGLSHAFRLEGGKWTRFETKSSSYEWDYAAGYRALDAFDAMAPTAEKLQEHERELAKDVPEDSPDATALRAVRGSSGTGSEGEGEGETDSGGSWKQLQTAAGPLYLWEDASNELPALTGPVRIRGDKGLVEPAGLTITGGLSVDVRGDLVLLGYTEESGKPVTRLWNAKTKALVVSLFNKNLVTFWPKPSGAASTPAPVAGPTPP